jgi:hypothetical protein
MWLFRSLDGSVGIATELRAGQAGFDRMHELDTLLPSTGSRPAEAHPASYLMGTGGSFLGNKAAGA